MKFEKSSTLSKDENSKYEKRLINLKQLLKKSFAKELSIGIREIIDNFITNKIQYTIYGDKIWIQDEDDYNNGGGCWFVIQEECI